MNKNMEIDNFDYGAFKTEALEKIKSGQPLTGKGGILLITTLKGPFDVHLNGTTRYAG